MANPDVPTVVLATGAKPAYLPAVRNASIRRLLWNDYLMLRHHADKPPNNGTFPCLIATIQSVDREISVVNSIEDLGVLLVPTWSELVL